MSGVWETFSEEPAEGSHTQNKRQQRRQETGYPENLRTVQGSPLKQGGCTQLHSNSTPSVILLNLTLKDTQGGICEE